MKFFTSLFFALALFISGIGASNAAEPDSIQKAELDGLVAQINNAAQKKDVSFIANNMPERLFKEMALRLKTDEETLKKNFINQFKI